MGAIFPSRLRKAFFGYLLATLLCVKTKSFTENFKIPQTFHAEPTSSSTQRTRTVAPEDGNARDAELEQAHRTGNSIHESRTTSVWIDSHVQFGHDRRLKRNLRKMWTDAAPLTSVHMPVVFKVLRW